MYIKFYNGRKTFLLKIAKEVQDSTSLLFLTPISTFKKMKTNLSDSDKGSKGADLM